MAAPGPANGRPDRRGLRPPRSGAGRRTDGAEQRQGTVPTALVCTLESTSLENGLRNAVALCGDADTLAVIAGALGEELHGLPGVLVETVKTRYLQGAEDITGALDALYPCAAVVLDSDGPDVSAGSGATPRRRIIEVRNKRGE